MRERKKNNFQQNAITELLSCSTYSFVFIFQSRSYFSFHTITQNTGPLYRNVQFYIHIQSLETVKYQRFRYLLFMIQIMIYKVKWLYNKLLENKQRFAYLFLHKEKNNKKHFTEYISMVAILMKYICHIHDIHVNYSMYWCWI